MVRTEPKYTRSYVYKCPECGARLPPIDSLGEEVLFKMCGRNSRHKLGCKVRMVLIRLKTPRVFKFRRAA